MDPANLGTVIAAAIAMIESVTNKSTSVNPERTTGLPQRKHPRRSPSAGAMPIQPFSPRSGDDQYVLYALSVLSFSVLVPAMITPVVSV